MPEFEEDSLSKVPTRRSDDYDVELGMAMSNSLKRVPGCQILSPEEIHQKIKEKANEFLEKMAN